MSLSKAGFDEWMRVATDDDIEYAMELIAHHRMHLHSILRIDNLSEIDSSLAGNYLKKFTLNPNTPIV
jgi:hypothetical protein